MSTAGPLRRIARLPQAVAVFCAERFPPAYGLYALLWATAADGGATRLAAHRPWRPSAATAGQATALLLAALALRMVDDLKDLPYDRVRHPDRPLPAGRIAPTELLVCAALAAAGSTAALGTAGGTAATAVLSGAFGIGLAHWAAVHHGLDFGRRPLLELATTYPIQITLSIALFTATAHRARPTDRRALVGIIAVFAGAFLPYEIGRKTRAGEGAAEHDGLYSASIPVEACLLAMMALSCTAVIGWAGLAHRGRVMPATNPARAAYLCGAGSLLALPSAATWPVARERRATPPEALSALFIVALYSLIIGTCLTVEEP